MYICANCDGEDWVCESHPEVPWTDGDGCCGAPGMPCKCNPEAMPPPGSIELVNHFGHSILGRHYESQT